MVLVSIPAPVLNIRAPMTESDMRDRNAEPRIPHQKSKKQQPALTTEAAYRM